MVFALTPHAQRHLGKQFEARMPRKVYLARLAGRLEPRTGTVDQPLVVDWPNRPRQKIDHRQGRPALTDVFTRKGGTLRPGVAPRWLAELAEVGYDPYRFNGHGGERP